MKKSKFDIIIKILLTISITCLVVYILNRNAKRTLNLGIIIFIISSLLIIIHLVKNITLKNKAKIVKYNIEYQNIKEKINENLTKANFTLCIEEIKENMRINHYKKEKTSTSMYMISIIECKELNKELLNDIKTSITNICKKDKHEKIKYLYSVPIIIVGEPNEYLIKNIEITTGNNIITLMCGITKKEHELYIMEKAMKENTIKYHEAAKILFEILEIERSQNKWKKKN